MVNRKRLAWEMRKRNISCATLAMMIGNDCDCLYKKLKGYSEFTLEDILAISKVLDFDKKTIMHIFFM